MRLPETLMDVGELLARYAAGERDFIGVELSNANLSGAKLIGADLYDANLSGTKLIGADLNGADLGEANLIGANMRDTNLSGVNLIYANLGEANLSNANLSDANLRFANLSNVNLSNANLSGARLDGTILAYQKVSEELHREKQQLTEQVQLLQAQLEKQKLTEELRQTSNQGIAAPYQWNSFYFRSKTEIKIAEALDKAGVLFYPNCKARLSSSAGREGKETDFLVFYQGKWGILEVDGEPWHPPSRTVHDHERDRLSGLRQKLSPNKAQTGFISSKHVTIQIEPIKKSTRHSCSKGF